MRPDSETVDLNAWLAERVMGWRRSTDGRHWLVPGVQGWDSRRATSDEGTEEPWLPTVYIGHAWEVVKRLSQGGHSVFLDHHFAQGHLTWKCRFSTNVPADEANTAQTAICLAAKRITEWSR